MHDPRELLNCLLLFSLVNSAAPAGAQTEAKPALRGQVRDQLGGVLTGATVTARDLGGAERSATTDSEGMYAIANLAPGQYSVRATAPKFAAHEIRDVMITAGRVKQLNFKLRVTLRGEEIIVESDALLSLGPENNAGALVLRGTDLDSLPSGPGGLEAILRALALRSSGPFGPQILINGFSGGRLPPKSSIREIRINQNPFAAEYSQMGLSRIEILTKPGTDTFHGESFFYLNDDRFNSRNPYAPFRAPFQSRLFGGNLSGPIVPKRASFFADFERQEIENNAIVNATILDSALRITPSNLVFLTPQRSTTFSPRLDFRLNQNNTLVARYADTRGSSEESGIGDFSLLSRAYDTSSREQSLQLTETSVFSPSVSNETRFQYIRALRSQRGDNSMPTISVPEAFLGGGSDIGLSSNDTDSWELHNNTTWQRRRHTFRFGGQARGVSIADLSSLNFGGTYTFTGRLAPQLNASDQVVRGANGQPVLVPITTIESYRRTLLFRQLGFTSAQIRTLGGGATQFSISGGTLEARVNQYDVGAFVQDDWRLRPNFTLSMGLRYERQDNIGGVNWAPRAGFAWGPDAGAQDPKTVIRGGFGVFYDRFSENLVLQANRFDGVNQRQFIVSDPAILDMFPRVPTIQSLAAFAIPPTVIQIAGDLRAPYVILSSVSVERELPSNFTVAASYIKTHAPRVLRSRNINAPLPGTVTPFIPLGGQRPSRNAGEVFAYESTGTLDQNQLLVNLVNRFGDKATIWATYTLTKSMSDTDGAGTFPASSYDLSTEYGRSATDARHSVYWGGWISTFWGIELNPLVIHRSGLPFNITTGQDANGDGLFMERPALATDRTRPSVVTTRFGAFDLSPAAGQQIIPRNFGEGPAFFIVNLRLSKTFKLVSESRSRAGGRQYAIIAAVQGLNLLNRINPGTPVGNLSSPFFGNSYSSAGDFGLGSNPAGNRRLELQISFHF